MLPTKAYKLHLHLRGSRKLFCRRFILGPPYEPAMGVSHASPNKVLHWRRQMAEKPWPKKGISCKVYSFMQCDLLSITVRKSLHCTYCLDDQLFHAMTCNKSITFYSVLSRSAASSDSKGSSLTHRSPGGVSAALGFEGARGRSRESRGSPPPAGTKQK